MRKLGFAAIAAIAVCAAAASGALAAFLRGGGGRGAQPADAGGGGRQQARVFAERAEEGGEAGFAEGAALAGGEARVQTAFALEAGETAVQVLNADINLDGTYDQVCAVRRGAEPEIYIVCAIQNPVTTAYTRMSPVRTAVTQTRTLLVYFADVTGRQGNALVYSGMNSSGLQALGIFSVEEDSGAPSGFSLREMLSITADGAIQIEEVRRSEAYRLGMAAGASYPVVSYHSVPSGDTAAQIRRTYAWNPASGVYELSAETRISTETAGAMIAQELREGGDDALFKFFKGVWYKSDGGTAGRQVAFDLANGEIIFVGGQTQEVFVSESVSARRYGVYLVARNSLISSIRRLVDIEIAAPDEIKIRATEDVSLKIGVDSDWDGSYRRMKGSPPPSAESASRRLAAILEGAELGWTDSASGAVYVFEGGALTTERPGGAKSEEGKYAIYMMRDAPVMQLKDAGGSRSFYLLREEGEGRVVMQEVAATATELKATGAAEIELAAITR